MNARILSFGEVEEFEESDDEIEFEEGDSEIWAKEFVNSKYFGQLNSEQQENAGFTVNVFLDYMGRYTQNIPSKWTVYDVLEVAAGLMPRKIAEGVSFFRHEADILIVFFDFLKSEGQIKNVQKFQNAIDQARPEIIAIASNSDNWGFAKQFAMKASGENVDLSDKKALNKFMRKQQKEALGQIVKNKLRGSFLGKLFGSKS